MYLVGAEHPLKTRTLELVKSLIGGGEELTTSAEAFQEIIHRYRALDNQASLDFAYEALEELSQQVFEVRKEDVDRARLYATKHPKLSSRDCLHVAIMKRLGCSQVWTYDQGFDQIGWLERVC